MGGGKKRGLKNQSNQKKGTRKNIAPVEMAEVLMGSSSGSRTDLCPEGELALIRGILIDAKSNTLYHISNRWWQKWIEYVNQDQQCNTNDGSEHCDATGSSTLEKPSMIDNSDLINSSSAEIIDTLEEGRDYVLLPEEVWNKLHSWYGGGPVLPRRVISSGCSQAELAMEVYHLRHELLFVPERYRSAISKSKKIKPLLDAVSHSAQEQKIDLVLTVTTSNLGADSLYLNEDNIKSNHWNRKTSSQIDLMNKKKAWRTTVTHSGRRIRICEGWTAFCVDNKFEDGYICKFRKIEGKKLVVTTFELVEVAKSNVCKQGEQPAMLLEEQPAVLLEQQVEEQPAVLLEEQPEELEDKQPEELKEEQDLKVQNIGKQQFSQMESQTMELRSSSSFIKQELLKVQEFCTEQVSQLREGIITLSNAAEKYDALLTENQKLFNEVQELKGNIRVFCRVRPFLPGQVALNSVVEYVGEDGQLVLTNPTKPRKEGGRKFRFNKVYGPTATQAEVFADIKPLVRSVLDGFNVCILAYGQTGSGKTYTMTGPDGASEEDWGVNYRALDALFKISQSRKPNNNYEVKVQIFEIYNEQVLDLLCDDSSRKKLAIVSTTTTGLAVPDASIYPVTSVSDVIKLMNIGVKNRSVGATAMNERSSRSHSIVTIHVRDTNSGLHGHLQLVDLAGSEKSDPEAKEDRNKEGREINKSLKALGDVIWALARKRGHIPYRNNKLTHVLKSSLEQQAKTLMLVHINPESNSYSNSMYALEFAERVSGVELGAAKSSKDESLASSSSDPSPLRSGLNPRARVPELPPHHHPLGTALRTPQRPPHHHPLGSATKYPPPSTTKPVTKPATGQRKDA